VLRFLGGLLKVALACLLAGVAMSFLGVTTEKILSLAGFTPQSLWDTTVGLLTWAWPNIVLGSLVVIPLWAITYLFIPPGHE